MLRLEEFGAVAEAIGMHVRHPKLLGGRLARYRLMPGFVSPQCRRTTGNRLRSFPSAPLRTGLDSFPSSGSPVTHSVLHRIGRPMWMLS